jgi:hypothetical protein
VTKSNSNHPIVFLKPIPGVQQNLIGLKFDFVALSLADPENRGVTKKGTQGSRMTPFQGGVLTVLVNRVNPKRGYSYASVRHVAELLDAWPSTVGNAIKKLVARGTLIRVAGGKKNRAQRLAPNWSNYIDVSDYGFASDKSTVSSMDIDSTVHAHETDTTVHDHGVTPVSTSMARTKRNVGSNPKGKEPKRSGPYGPRGGPAKAGPPKPVGPGKEPNTRKGKSTAHSRKGNRQTRAGISRDAIPTKDGVLAHRNREAT